MIQHFPHLGCDGLFSGKSQQLPGCGLKNADEVL
jgi:hypothetical protein